MAELFSDKPDTAGGKDTPADETSEGSFSLDALRLQLDQFEGPFEVLLYLIKEQEIDIFDIPIVQVTQQYLGFLDMLHTEQLDVAGDFLVLAATLIQIKSRMILPVEVEEDEEEGVEEEDPRLELVVKLLEYRKFRDLARVLGNREELQADAYGRRVKPVLVPGEEDEEEFLDVSLYDLMKSVRGMMRFLMGEGLHRVVLEGASVDEKISRIEVLLADRESVSWTDLRQECGSLVEQVCFLLAILELCRMHRVRVRQHAAFGEIRLFARQDAAPPDSETGNDAAEAV